MPKKILVTGGAGYIGSVAVERLIQSGYDVVVLDNLSMGHRTAVHPDAAFVKGDLADRQAIESVFDAHRIDAIMHFASKTLVGESMEEPFRYLGDNVVNGVNLLTVAVDRGVRQFILSSTANLFDQPSKIPIDENEAIVPGSPYGESKYILERMLYWLDRTRQLRYAALRYFNAAGATEQRGEDHDPEMHLIPIVLQVAQGKREKVTVFGDDYPTPDGTCLRDYIHIADLADAHILALEALDQGSCAYNLGNGQGFSVRDVIQTASEVSGCEIPFEVGPRRSGDPPVLVASSEKITRQLGWEPKYPTLRQIVQTAWDWHQAHPNGYDSGP